VGQRSGDPAAEPELRARLLAEAIEFRRSMVGVLLDPEHDWAKTAWEQLSGPVDALAAGQPHRFHGYELPDGHPARVHGVHTDWVLGADDVLRPGNDSPQEWI
jgi:hypothetical protein